MALKFFTPSAKKTATPLRDRLHTHLTGYQPHRGVKNVHASEMTKPEGLCPRFYALVDMFPKLLKDEWLTTSEQVTFQIGRDMQDNIVNWFGDMGIAVGHWKCLACEKQHQFQKRPSKCDKCGCRAFKPEEVRFKSEETGASCGVDMLVSLGNPKLTPVEIKTMDKEQFKSLAGPLAEHKLRSTLYLKLIADSVNPWSNLIDTSHIKLLYTTKGGYGCADPTMSVTSDKFTPFKEFTVNRDDAAVAYLEKPAVVVKLYREGEVGIPQGICATALVPRAKRCSACSVCFSGDYPASYDWI